MAAPWSLDRGATVLPDGAVRFRVWAPRSQSAAVVIPREGGDAVIHPLERGGDGVLEATIGDVPPGTDYLIRLDGERDRPDPVSRHQPHGVHGPSRVVDPAAFAWSDGGWTGIEPAELIIYELHVGTFSERGSFAGVIDRLPYLRDLGVTAIELMPVAQFPGARNWGYDGVHPYAPHNTYGGPQGLRSLVDAAHAAGLAVVLDVVYNHLGPEGNYLSEFGAYFTDRYATPWGRAINFDGPESDEVRRYFIENALYWVTEYHIDALRLDAVHAIFDLSAMHILEEMTEAVHRQADALGRQALVIAESDLNDPRLVRPRWRGGYELDAAWSDDFHHAIHAYLTGERDGYYADFGSSADVVKAMTDRYVLDGTYSRFRRRRHGAPARDVDADRLVVFIQNHDQVGNRARGDRLSTLVDFEARKLAASLLLLSPYVPLLFMGEEYGEVRPFLYFVDHGDESLLRAVYEGRKREFARFDWHDDIPDPGSPETFTRSIPDFTQAGAGEHLRMSRLYKDLIRLRREEPALRPGTPDYRLEHDLATGWIGAEITAGAGRLLACFNLGSRLCVARPTPGSGGWRRRFCSADEAYGGPGTESPDRLSSDGRGQAEIALTAASAVLYKKREGVD